MRKVNPYIGITDFTNFEQVGRMLQLFIAHRAPDSNRMLHVGVMTSYSTLNDTEMKWSNAFPPKEKIAGIFQPIVDEIHYYCLHYLDYNHYTTFLDLARAIQLAGPYVNAIQLNMTWPEPQIVASAVHTSRRQIEVILQIGKNAMEEANNNPAEVVERLEQYNGIVDRILLGKSLGSGIGIDAGSLIPFVQAIREAVPTLGIGFAGDLGPETIHLAEPLIAVFSDLSIDAQERLRPSGNVLDPIDWGMAEEYLIQALQLLT